MSMNQSDEKVREGLHSVSSPSIKYIYKILFVCGCGMVCLTTRSPLFLPLTLLKWNIKGKQSSARAGV